jgi:predicted 3-demethylubiquinone-9 3-methyltransferase (glyoxalase superfamily)
MFDDQTDEAVNFYLATFKNAKLLSASRYGADGPGPAGTIMSATFQLEGQEFMAFNGGPHFSFSEGMSLFIRCQTQVEVDELWEKLSEGGEKQQCGWLKDKFGVSWQIIPTALMELMGDPDPEKSQRVVQAMLQMTKIDIAKLRQAYEG